MKFRPLHDRVVVRRIDAEMKSAGGIIIPGNAKGDEASPVPSMCGNMGNIMGGVKSPLGAAAGKKDGTIMSMGW